MNLLLRSATVLALFAAALAASAQTTAYSDLGMAPSLYSVTVYGVTPNNPFAARFVSTQTGTMTAFLGAVNNQDFGGPVAYTLNVYADGAGQTVGTLLGSFSGLSTGAYGGYATSALSTVLTPGGPTLIAGSAYWAEVAPSSNVYWNVNNTGVVSKYRYGGYGYFNNSNYPAFSVQVNPTPTPEPSALAALGLGAVAMLRRRKRA